MVYPTPRMNLENGISPNALNERMSDPKIKPATDDEKIWAARLMAASEPWIILQTSEKQCLKVCLHPEHLVFIAHDNGQAAAMIVLHPRGLAGSPYIKSICVSESFRGKGVGARMIRFAETLFRPDSKHIFLCVSSFNNRAMAFYKSLGYNKVGEFQDYIIKGASEQLFHKSLL
jgi:ribosomal-protein-alanine N-acetyltransferase